MINIFQIAPFIMGGISIYAAIYHFVLYQRLGSRHHVFSSFAWTCVFSGFFDILNGFLYLLSNYENAIIYLRLIYVIIQIYAISFMWYVFDYIKYPHKKIGYIINVYLILSILISLIDNGNLILDLSKPTIQEIILSPNFGITYYGYSSGIFKNISGYVYLVLNLFLFVVVVRDYLKKHNKQTRYLIISYIIFFVGVGNDVAVEAAWINQIYITEYAFLGMVLLMTYGFQDQVLNSIVIESQFREQYKTIIEQMSDGLGIIDEKEQFIYVNGKLCQLLEQNMDDIIGKKIFEFYNSKSQEIFKNLILNQVDNKQNGYEIEWIRKSGKILNTIVSITRLKDENGDFHGISMIVTDITSQKLVEETLSEAKKVAETANQAKSNFILNVSHELRTPLNAILGFSEILIDHNMGMNTEQKDHIETIHASGKVLHELVNTILDITKIESGKMTINKTFFSIIDLVESVIILFKELALKKNIQIEILPILENIPKILNDQGKIRQILLNLLNNAIKFTDHSGKIQVEIKHSTEDIIVSVKDNGIGIPQDKIHLIFQQFFQIEDPQLKSHEGTGLGLYLCKKLIDLLGGKIWVQSVYGQGSQFSFSIPIYNP